MIEKLEELRDELTLLSRESEEESKLLSEDAKATKFGHAIGLAQASLEVRRLISELTHDKV